MPRKPHDCDERSPVGPRRRSRLARRVPAPGYRARAARVLWAALLAGASLAPLRAQPCAELPAERAVSDGGSGCLAVLPVVPPDHGDRSSPRVLIVMIHGDRTGSLERRHLDRWIELGRALQAEGRRVLLLIRPGYRTPDGDSSGWANPRDDDYTAENVARVAGALASLRRTLQPQRIVLVGHSGGAATAALVLGRHPGAADAALLLGCPCDVPPWREHRARQRGGFDRPWTQSLNPLAFVSGIAVSTPVHAATGTLDDNTLPRFAAHWVARAVARGVAASHEEVEGHDHGSILRWDGIAPRLQALIAALPD